MGCCRVKPSRNWNCLLFSTWWCLWAPVEGSILSSWHFLETVSSAANLIISQQCRQLASRTVSFWFPYEKSGKIEQNGAHWLVYCSPGKNSKNTGKWRTWEFGVHFIIEIWGLWSKPNNIEQKVWQRESQLLTLTGRSWCFHVGHDNFTEDHHQKGPFCDWWVRRK